MNRMLLLAAAGAVVALAVWRPAAGPAPLPIGAAPTAAPHHGRAKRAWRNAPGVVVYVAGAVVQPGLYTLPATARANDAVLRAKGLRPDADAEAVNLAEHVTDGEEVRVPRVGESTPRPSRRRSTRKRRVVASYVDINQANAQALASLPGIGATLAERIVEYRRLNGPFASLDELADVAGMSQRRIDGIAPYLRVHDASP